VRGQRAAPSWSCAIYTRKSTEHNLDLEFNSLDAQREACEAYIKSQAHEGWRLIPDHYDDGDIIVVYKVDRLTRSLSDFAKLVELFDQHGVSFVSAGQPMIGSAHRGEAAPCCWWC
jgi:site-specific DNA recombinase